MKISQIASLVATVGAASPDFETYKATFGKTYPSPTDEVQASKCWEENVEKLTKQAEDNPNLEFEENKFSDQCWNDFSAQRMMPLDQVNGVCGHSPVDPYPHQADESKAVDWRTQGYVNPVKDQQHCGSCWAFSSIGCMEGAHFKATGKLLSFSEQELVSCSKANNGCNGGMPGEAFQFAVENGIALEADYPYTAGGGTTESCDSSKEAKKAATFSSWIYLPSKNGHEPVILAALQNEGPVSVTVFADQVWHQYSGGIISGGQHAINHAVLAVGYGHEGTQAYWNIRNSWGASWGESGYIRLAYGENTCGITTCLSWLIRAGPSPPSPTPTPTPTPRPTPPAPTPRPTPPAPTPRPTPPAPTPDTSCRSLTDADECRSRDDCCTHSIASRVLCFDKGSHFCDQDIAVA